MINQLQIAIDRVLTYSSTLLAIVLYRTRTEVAFVLAWLLAESDSY